MTMNEYQQDALRTESCASAQFDPRILNGIMGLCGETGECMDLLKKSIFQGHTLDRDRLAEELGDVFWYLAVSADAIGYDLESIAAGNVRKLKARYPHGFDAERSVHRGKYERKGASNG